ncbi:AN1-type zinc finger protein 4-like isoform X2 [Plodia interpunctella]|uniref:AN1-type zinc finger protein 4-like isoform X2 n=1 Tax=Plodia interpunctella TaxID=58824 RepID=UPI0023688827|nr:AN1-type zinc finger protein 4-like isoform X2 [Plodia interpunctella]
MSQHGCPERLSNRSKAFQEDAPSQPTMEVLVETLTGTAFEMTVSPSDTILAIKSKIFRVEGIPVSQQHILYNMKELEDSTSLRSHAITDGARLRLVLGMKVGPISTRRLPPPASVEPWRDIERLLDGNRDESEWCNSNGCRVTVVVLRDGGRINLLLRQNSDGAYCPVDTDSRYSSSLTLVEQELESGVAGAALDNELTMGKMIELRRRMETMSLRRGTTEWSVTPNLPPIGTRTDSEPAVQEDTDRLKLSDALAGSILVQGRREREEDGAILEECLDTEQCHIRDGSPQLAAKNLAPIPAAEYGPLVCGSGATAGAGWGSAAPISHSASSLHALQSLHALAAPLRPPHAPRHPPLQDAVFSSSTSDLEKLKRNSRILPALSRHRNRSHLHLSDDGLDLRPHNLSVGCERRLRRHLNSQVDRQEFNSVNSVDHSRSDLYHNGHTLADLHDSAYLRSDFQPGFKTDFDDINPSDVERERNVDSGRLFSYEDFVKEDLKTTQSETAQKDATGPAPPPAAASGGGGGRARCSWCRKRLSIATEHACRCGARFCAAHRYAEVHGCDYDYRAPAQRRLRRDNPRVAAPKLPKI